MRSRGILGSNWKGVSRKFPSCLPYLPLFLLPFSLSLSHPLHDPKSTRTIKTFSKIIQFSKFIRNSAGFKIAPNQSRLLHWIKIPKNYKKNTHFSLAWASEGTVDPFPLAYIAMAWQSSRRKQTNVSARFQ